jgi:hypothetical protein
LRAAEDRKKQERRKEEECLTQLQQLEGNGWMNLKFELGIPNTIMHRVSKLQLDPTVAERDMGLQS